MNTSSKQNQGSLLISNFLFIVLFLIATTGLCRAQTYFYEQVKLADDYVYMHNGYKARDINDEGVIVGDIWLGTGVHNGFVRAQDTFQEFTDSARDTAEAVNNNGDIVFNTVYTDGSRKGILQKADGSIVDFSKTGPPSSVSNIPSGINTHQTVIGYYSITSDTKGAYTFDSDYAVLDLSSVSSKPYMLDINDTGEMVGWDGGANGLYIHGGTIDLIQIPGASQTAVYAINDNGMMAGYYVKDGVETGFVRNIETAEYSDIHFPGSTATRVFGMNNHGQVVGDYTIDGKNYGFKATPVNFSSGVMAYYPFTGNAWDASGNRYDGTVNNASLSADRFGTPNSAYAFDSGYDVIDVTGFDWHPDQLSISAWIKIGSSSTQCIVSGHGSNLANETFFYFGTLQTGEFVFRVDTDQNNGVSWNVTDLSIPLNQWVHIVLVWDGGEALGSAVFYVNGVKSSSISQVYAGPLSSELVVNELNIGLRFGTESSEGQQFEGSIDDVFIYNRLLSDVEAAGLYDAGTIALEREGVGELKEKILWNSDRGGSSDIWMMNPDGSGKQQLTDDPGEDLGPSISPDGTKIAFASDRSGHNEIWLMNADGGNEVQLTTGTYAKYNPIWSPDGSQIYYASNEGGGWVNLWVVNTDGSGAAMVMANAARVSLNPEGTKFTFYAEPGPNANNYNLSTSGIDGSDRINLSSLAGLTGYEAPGSPRAWGRNGKILITAQEPSWINTSDYDIYWIAEDGSQSGVILDESNHYNCSAGWSPDDESIVYFGKGSGNWDIYRINKDGGQQVQLTSDSGSDQSPVWGKVFICSLDSDSDGLQDDWENAYLGNLSQDGDDDYDGDGLTNAQEETAGTNPTQQDTDGDGLSDKWEIDNGKNPVQAEGLVAYYPFNGTAQDAAGNGHDGSVNGADLSEDRFGNADAAYLFNGAGDYIQVPDHDDLELSHVRTISAWYRSAVKTDDVNSVIVSKYRYDTVNEDGYIMAVNTYEPVSDITVWVKNGSGGGTIDDIGFSVENGTWIHQVMVMDGQLLHHYVNGVKVKTFEYSDVTGGNTRAMLIGAGLNAANQKYNFFKGGIDDVRIYDRPLSGDEIKELYLHDGSKDSDQDGMQDWWETARLGALDHDGTMDTDDDGLTDLEEFLNNCDPVHLDTDNDGFSDGWEVNTNQSDPTTADRLRTYHPFNGNVRDKSTNSYDGTIDGHAPVLTLDRFGNADSAYEFDGIDDYIDLGNSCNQGLAGGFTMSGWFYFDTDANMALVNDYDGQATLDGIQYDRIDQKIRFFGKNGHDNYRGVLTDAEFPAGSWYHITSVFDGTPDSSGFAIYVNGVKQSTTEITMGEYNSWADSPDPLRAGVTEWVAGPSLFFDGKIDDLRLYTRPLSSPEIQELYRTEAPPAEADGLVVNYLFNGTLNDDGSNGFDGTNSGAQLTADRFNTPDSAYFFDNSYISSPDGLGITVNDTQQLTVLAWIRLDMDPPNNAMTIVSGEGTGSGDDMTGAFEFTVEEDRSLLFKAERPLDSGIKWATGSYAVKAGQWTQVAMVWKKVALASEEEASGAVEFYINGVKMDGIVWNFISSTVGIDISQIFIGNRNGADCPFYGAIDNVKVFNRALSGDEINAIYNDENGLVAYYPFNGNAEDESGNGNDGVVNGAILTTDRFGHENSAYAFDGNDVITTPAFASQASGSVSVWFKPSEWFNGGGVVSSRIGYEDGDFMMESSESYPTILIASWKDSSWCGLETPVNTSGWNHIVYTWDSATGKKLYLDGVLKEENSNTDPVFNGRPILFGEQFNSFFKGVIDDIHIYNRALGAGEVTALYTADKSLIACYPFNGNAEDESGKNNHGSVDGATLTTDRFGNADSAYAFDGTDDTIRVAHSADFNTDTITISFWAQADDPAISSQMLIHKDQAGNSNHDFHIKIDNGTLKPQLQNGTDQSNPTAVVANGWNHYVFTSDGTTDHRVYINGVQAFTCPITWTINKNTRDLMLGGNEEGLYLFDGKIDDVSIYNRVLSPDEIRQLCLDQGGQIAYYPFNGNAEDKSGNGHHGTVSGATPATDRFGNADSAYAFDGVDDFIDLDSLDTFRESRFTLSAWFYTESTADQFIIMTSSGHIALFQADGIIGNAFDNRDGDSPAHCTSKRSVVMPNRWYHAALAVDGNAMSLYLNGELLSDTSGSDTPTGDYGRAEIGANGRVDSTHGVFFNGILDDIHIFNRTLSPDEIKGVFRSEAPDNTTPQIIGEIPDQSRFQDTPAWTVDLTAFESDGESDHAGLSWTVTSNSDSSVLTAQITDDSEDILTLTPQPGAAGTVSIRLTLTDEWGASDFQDISVTLTENIADFTPDNSLIALWELDGDGTDSGPNSYNLNINAGLVQWIPGVDGQALKMNGPGSSGQRAVSSTGGLLGYPGNGDLTIEAWMKFTSLPTGDRGFIVGQNSPGMACQDPYTISLTADGRINFHIDQGDCEDPREDLDHDVNYLLGQWFHVAAVYKYMQGMQLYINGQLVSQKATPIRMQSLSAQSYPFTIGGIYEWTDTGEIQIDRVRVSSSIPDNGSTSDFDGDGLNDGWETTYFNGLDQDAAMDPDSDGLTNEAEQAAGTDPTAKDTDKDGLPDKWEIDNSQDPLSAAGLVAYYPFEESFQDSSDNGNHAAGAGNPVFAQGIKGSAVQLDGVDDYVDPEYGTLDVQSFSICGWVNQTRTNDADTSAGLAGSSFFSGRSGRTNSIIALMTEQENRGGAETFVQIMGFSGGERPEIDSNVNLIDGTWHFVALTSGSQSVSLYIDGVLIGQDDQTTSGSLTTEAFIGAASNICDSLPACNLIPYSHLNGLIDEVRIFNRELTADEIRQIQADTESGWEDISPSLASTDAMTGVWGTAEGDLIVCSDAGSVYQNSAGAWTTMDGSHPQPLKTVWGLDSQRVWVGGATDENYAVSPEVSNGIVLNGSVWIRSVLADDGGFIYPVEDIWASSGQNLYTATMGGLFQWDGTTWHRLSDDSVNSVYGLESGVAFTAGYSGNVNRVENQTATAIRSFDGSGLRDIWAASESAVFVAGDDGTFLKYDGNSWKLIDTRTTADLKAVWGFSATDVYLAGENGIIIHYDGTVCTFMDSETTETINDLWGDALHLYAAGSHNTVLKLDTGPRGLFPPGQPVPVSPADGQDKFGVDQVLSWQIDRATSDPSLVYTVLVDTVTPPLAEAAQGISSQSVTPDSLSYDTTYFWQVIAKNGAGLETRGSIWEFTTEPAPVTTYSVTLSSTNGGSITNPGEGSHSYNAGDQIIIQAAPEIGYEFSGWSGGALGAVNPLTVTVNSDLNITANFTEIPPNQAPVNQVPGAQETDQGVSLEFSQAGSNQISISDPDLGSSQAEVNISVSHGILNVIPFDSVVVTGNGSRVMKIRGNLTDVNGTLDGMTYSPDGGFAGDDTLSVVTSDLGNTGSGGAKTDSDTVIITVLAPPENTAPQIVGNIPDQSRYQDSLPWTVDLSGYKSDQESDNDNLIWTVADNTNPGIIAAQINADILALTPQAQATGTVIIRLVLTDEGGANDWQDISVTLTSKNGLAAYYKFDNSTLDEVTWKSGAILGTEAYDDGSGGPALKLDGDSSVLADPALNKDTSFTVSAWVNAAQINLASGHMILKERAFDGDDACGQVSAGNYGIGVLNGVLAFMTSTIKEDGSCVKRRIDFQTRVSTNQDYFVSGVFDKSSHTMKLYVDSVLVAQDDEAGTALRTHPEAVLRIGRNSDAAIQHWNGTIDDVRIYERVLTQSELQDLYSERVTSNSLTLSSSQGGVVAEPGEGTNLYRAGTIVSLRAEPDSGYIFSGWSGDATGTINPLSITVNSDMTIMASFSQIPANQAPVNTVPSAQQTDQDTDLVFSGNENRQISVSDPDIDGGQAQVSLSVSHGTLSAVGEGATEITGNNGSSLTLTGGLTDINNTLNSLVYHPESGYTGQDSLVVTANDQGNTGSGGAQTDTDTIQITVNPISMVTTQAVSNIDSTTATGNGTLVSLGALNPVGHGVCWNTAGNPNIADDSCADNGAANATGAFTAGMTGLESNTDYYVRAYAAYGDNTVVYGDQVTFTTLSPPQPGTLQFTSSAWSVSEGTASLSISVSRTNGSDGAASVDFDLDTGGTAENGKDYQFTSGSLTWQDGEDGEQNIILTIVDDHGIEAPETVNLKLTSPIGGVLGNIATCVVTITSDDIDVSPISGGVGYTLVVKENGTVYAWGHNSSGQLGDGSTIDQNSPVKVTGIEDVVSVSGGWDHSLVLKNDGTVWAWGANQYGQLGNGNNDDSLIPVKVSGLNSCISLKAGIHYSIALKTDGSVWAWGRNNSGQLGNGSIVNSNTPVKVADLENIKSIDKSSNSHHTIALKNDGTVWAWGANSYGQLGDGEPYIRRLFPVQVPDLTNIVAVSGGGYTSAALRNDGMLLTWGLNSYGQLGDGSTTDKNVPTIVNSLSDIISVEVGGYHAMALDKNGALWSWGRNENGQLGDGSLINQSMPTQILGISNIIAVSLGMEHSIALGDDNTVFLWGRNASGNIGNGTNSDQLTPIPVFHLIDGPIRPTYDLTVSSSNGGSVTQPGEDTFKYNENTEVSLVADSDYGFQFDRWIGPVTDADSPNTTVIVTENITVTAQFKSNNPPVIDQAGPISVTLSEDGAPIAWASPEITASDPDGDALTWSRHTGPGNGTLTISGSGESPAYTYTPNAHYHGPDSFKISVSDNNGGSDDIEIQVTVTSVNDPISLKTNHQAEVDLLGSVTLTRSHLEITDADGDEIYYRITTRPSCGQLKNTNTNTVLGAGSAFTQSDINAGNRIVYENTGSTCSDDSFVFTAEDGNGSSIGGTIFKISIKVENQSPTALPASYSGVIEDQTEPLTGTLQGTDDNNPNGLVFSVYSNPRMGVLYLQADGSFTYKPNSNRYGDDYFYFRVNDGNSYSAKAKVDIQITPVNDPPVAGALSVSTPMDTPLSIQLTVSDPDNTEGFGFNVPETTVAGGLLTGSNGKLLYTPPEGFIGRDSFVYTVEDNDATGSLESGEATVDIDIQAPLEPNQIPVAHTAVYSIAEDEALTDVFLTGTDKDSEDTLTYKISSYPAKGSLYLLNSGTGAFKFIPQKNQNGEVTFSFKAMDGRDDSEAAVVRIDITPVNDAPEISGAPGNVARTGQMYSFDAAGSDVDGDTLVYSVQNCPDWALFDSEEGRLYGTPGDNHKGEVYSGIVIRVTDGIKTVELPEFEIIVLGEKPVTRLTPLPGTYNTDQTLTMEAVAGESGGTVQVFYTFDSNAAKDEFLLYSSALLISATRDIRYFAKEGLNEEDIRTARFVIDKEAPLLTSLTDPAGRDGVSIDAFNLIKGQCGDEGGSGVAALEVKVTNGTIFLGETGTEGATRPVLTDKSGFVSLTPDGYGRFEMDVSGLKWPAGEYTLTVRITDNAGNEHMTTRVFSYINPANAAYTELDILTSANVIKPEQSVTVSGQLFRLPDIGLDMAGRTIRLIVTDPSGGTMGLETQTYDGEGRYRFEAVSGFSQEGEYQIRADFEGVDGAFAASSAGTNIYVGDTAGYAVIIQGKRGQEGQSSYKMTADRIYDRFMSRGFIPENIQYFNHDPGSEPWDKASVQAAVETWAKDKMNQAPGRLYVVFVDHGESGKIFLNDDQVVTASEMASWLSTLERSLTDEAFDKNRVIILGACYSGSFINGLSGPGRVIVTSAAEDEESFKGPLEGIDTETNTPVRSGEFFLEELFTALGKGVSLSKAFNTASKNTRVYTRNGTGKNGRFFDDALQHPLLDDNGDGQGSNRVSGQSVDGAEARHVYLGIGDVVTGTDESQAVQITDITQTLRLSAMQQEALLSMTVTGQDQEDFSLPSWVEIRSPDKVLVPAGGSVQLENKLDKMLLASSGNLWEGVFQEFITSGKYEIFYYTRVDSDTVSPMARSIVYKNKAGNNPPTAFDLISPVDGIHPATLVFDWETSTDPDGDPVTYTLFVSTDTGFNDIVLSRDEIKGSAIGITFSDRLSSHTDYYWKVAATDEFGASVTSNRTGLFTTGAPGNEPGIVTGHVFSSQQYTVIAGVKVVEPVSGASAISCEDGSYYIAVPQGTVALQTMAGGYESGTFSGIDSVGGEITYRDLGVVSNGYTALDAAFIAREDIELEGELSASGPETGFSFEVVTDPEKGEIDINPDSGSFSYRASEPNYYGADKFSFRIFKGSKTSNTAWVSVTVNRENDAPVLDTAQLFSLTELEVSQTDSEGMKVVHILGDTVSDPDENPAEGMAVTQANQTIGTWQFSLDDGAQWSNINTGQGAMLLAADSSTRIRFVPQATGQAVLKFRAWDRTFGLNGDTGVVISDTGGASAFSEQEGNLTIAVRQDNHTPEAVPVSLETNEDTKVTGRMNGQDEDSSDSFVFTIKTRPSNGEAWIVDETTGVFSYTPDKNFSGSDSFTYTVSDGRLTSSPATVEITVNPVNDPPTAENIAPAMTVYANTGISLEFVLQGSDPENDPLVFSIVGDPDHGTAEVVGNIIRYMANSVSGTEIVHDSLIYRAWDGQAFSNTATVLIDVKNDNHPPVPGDVGVLTLDEDTHVSGRLTGEDPDGDSLVFSIARFPAKGQLTLTNRATGEFYYKPYPDAYGDDDFEFAVGDGLVSSVGTGSVSLTILPQPDPPVITGKPIAYAAVNEFYAFEVTATDPDNDALIFSMTGAPSWLKIEQEGGRTYVRGTPQQSDIGVTHGIIVRVQEENGSLTDMLAPFDLIVVENTDIPVTWASLAAGVYAGPLEVTLTCSDSEASIYYTTDGTVPTLQSLSYQGAINITATTTLKFAAVYGQGALTPVRSVHYIVDEDPPGIRVETPEDDSTVTAVGWIDGIVSDMGSGLSGVDVQITDGQLFLQGSGVFSDQPAWIAADLYADTGEWVIYTDQTSWVNETTYSVTARATDKAGNQTTANAMFVFSEQAPQQALTRMGIELSAPAIFRDQTIDVSGTIYRLPQSTIDMSGRVINLTVSGPDGSVVSRYQAGTYDTKGHFLFSDVGGFSAKGEYTVMVTFEGTRLLSPSSASATVQVGSGSGYAVIVQGADQSDSLYNAYDISARRIQASLEAQGIGTDDILVLTRQDGTRLKEQAASAVTLWAAQKMSQGPAPVAIILLGRTGHAGIVTGDNNEIISPADLDLWLDELEEKNRQAGVDELCMVFINGNYSESFIPMVSKEGRVIVTSAGYQEKAVMGLEEPDGEASGDFFMEQLFFEMEDTKSLGQAFDSAREKTGWVSRIHTGALDDPDGFAFGSLQHPKLDDNGDGSGHTILNDSSGDGDRADQVFIGVGAVQAGPVVTDVTATRYLGLDQTSVQLTQTLLTDSTVTAWAAVRKPSVTLMPTMDADPLTLNLEVFPMTPLQGQEGIFISDNVPVGDAGKYEVFYFARGTGASRYVMNRSVVYKNRLGNTPPSGFGLLSPASGSRQSTALGFVWEPPNDPQMDAVSYTLIISTDAHFNHVAFKQEEIAVSLFIIDDPMLLNDLSTYYWKVQAVDEYGSIAESDSGWFTTDNTNGIAAMFIGWAYDKISGEGVGGATVTYSGTSFGGTCTDPGGLGKFFVQTRNYGINLLAINKEGDFEPYTENVHVFEGVNPQHFVYLTPSAPNFAPVITPISDQIINEGSVTDPLEFSVGDAESSAEALVVTVSSSHPDMIESINVRGAGADRTVEVQPKMRANGSVEITVKVTDEQSAEASETFTVDITPMPDPDDVNNDNESNLEDLMLMMQILSGNVPDEQVFKEADANGDGQIGILETVRFLQLQSQQPAP